MRAPHVAAVTVGEARHLVGTTGITAALGLIALMPYWIAASTMADVGWRCERPGDNRRSHVGDPGVSR